MSETGRLEAELEVAKIGDKLEEAREAFQAKRDDPKLKKKYDDLSVQMQQARSEFRTNFPHEVPAPEDGLAEIDPVEAGTGVNE